VAGVFFFDGSPCVGEQQRMVAPCFTARIRQLSSSFLVAADVEQRSATAPCVHIEQGFAAMHWGKNQAA